MGQRIIPLDMSLVGSNTMEREQRRSLPWILPMLLLRGIFGVSPSEILLCSVLEFDSLL